MLSKFGTIFRRDGPTAKFATEKIKLERLKNKCEHILFKASTVFPFDFFPSDLIVDTEKVSIILRSFFGSEQIHCIPVKNITDLSLEHSLFFATIHILPARVFQNQVLSIGHLKKNEALKARNIIQGLVIADKENITLSSVSPDKEWLDRIEVIGKAI